jgi:hypothetical protein
MQGEAGGGDVAAVQVQHRLIGIDPRSRHRLARADPGPWSNR